MIGRQLKHYRIDAAIGAGGMGQVYRAHDTKLDRDVALKVLPAGSLADGASRRQFRKEAHALSRLSHPHIAALHDFDTEMGVDFLVMELVLGPSLDLKLRKGPLPESDVLRLGSQMVRGIAAAHEQGIIHRDLKPQNLRLTPDGLLKILDFGLARVPQSAGKGAVTQTTGGLLGGTPPYMSPEQLLGKRIDARTDVYGAGAVLYEMATGRPPFGMATGPELVAKILREAPPSPREVESGLSPGLDAIIVKAIDKDPDRRYQSAKELLVDLERAAGRSVAEPLRKRREGDRRKGLTGWAAFAATAVLVAFAALRPREPSITAVRSLHRMAEGIQGALRTDGTSVYFVEVDRPNDHLMTMPLGGGEAREIPLPWRDKGLDLYLLDMKESPPTLLLGRGYLGDLWQFPLPAGPPLRIGDLTQVRDARWSPRRDQIAYVERSHRAEALVVADREGRHPRRLLEVSLKAENASLGLIGWVPGTDRIRLVRSDSNDAFWDVPVSGGSPTRILVRPEPFGVTWSPDGRYFLLADDRGLVAHPEPGSWNWWRPTRTVLNAPTHIGAMTFAPTGKQLVAFVSRTQTEVVRLDPLTRTFTTLLGGALAFVADFSPDGTRVAWVSNDGGPGRLWTSRPDGTDRMPVTPPDRSFWVHPFSPIRWSPDGRRIAFSAYDDSSTNRLRVYLAQPDAGRIEELAPGDRSQTQADPCWSSDGASVTYGVFWGAPDAEIYLRRVDLQTRAVTKIEGSEGLWSPKCSRDGRILAIDYFSQRAVPGEGLQFFKLGGAGSPQWTGFSVAKRMDYPTWSRNGRYFYGLQAEPRAIVRFDLTERRLETVFGVEGLGASTDWVDLDPNDQPLVHRDVSQREIVLLDWKAP